MIEARGLVKHYRSTLAVDNLSFDVRLARSYGFRAVALMEWQNSARSASRAEGEVRPSQNRMVPGHQRLHLTSVRRPA
jgi:hypothetical protein